MYKFIIYFLLFSWCSVSAQTLTFRNISFSKFEVKIYKNGVFTNHNYLKTWEEVTIPVENSDNIRIEIRNYEKNCDNFNTIAKKFLSDNNAKPHPVSRVGDWIVLETTVNLPWWAILFDPNLIVTPSLYYCNLP